MAYPKYILTGKTPATTYENLVQFNYESSSLVNGDGNEISASLNLNIQTASYANTASVARNVQSTGQVTIRSSTSSVAVIATTDVFLSATGAMYLEAGGANIEMYPASQVKVFGGLDFTGALTNNGSPYTASTVGLSATKSFIANNVTQSVYIQNGLIVNWTP